MPSTRRSTSQNNNVEIPAEIKTNSEDNKKQEEHFPIHPPDEEQEEERDDTRNEDDVPRNRNDDDETPRNDRDDDSVKSESNEEITELRRLFDRIPIESKEVEPKSWADVHSLKYLTKNTTPLTNKLLLYPTLVNHPIDAIDLAQEFSPISFLTIASGEKHRTISFHSVNYVSDGENTRCLALIGAKTRATAVEIYPTQLFRLSLATVPNLESFINNNRTDTPLQETRQIRISNSIPIPPHFARLTMELTPSPAHLILEKILNVCIRLDTNNFRKSSTDPEAEPQPQDMPITTAHLPLFQHLYAYSTMKSPRQAGFALTDDDYAIKWVTEMDNTLTSPRRKREEESEDESDSSYSNETEQHNNTNPKNTNRPSHFTFTGAHDPSQRRSTSAQTPPNQTTTNTNDENTRSVISAMENMTNNHSRFTHQMERLVNATASKFNDDGTKKIGSIIKEVISNASTEDGENPSDDITTFARDILSLPGDQPLIHLNILFQKHKVRARATPKFIAAIRKGNLTYENGIPDGLSITQLPQSLQGTELEELDIGKMLNMEENGTITEVDTVNMNKSILQVSRTIHYLQDKTRAWSVFCAEYFGPHSYTALEADSWNTWIEENFNELQEIKASRDRDLPVKIEVAISEQFNRIFRSAMLGVPTESAFNSVLREGILTSSTYLSIPTAIKTLIEKPNKRKNENNGSAQTSKKPRGAANKVTHDNQPRELNLTQDQYRSKAIPYIQNNKDKLPKYDNNTDECMKYTLLGHCNGDCPRSRSHTKVNKNTQRYEKLAKLRTDIIQSNPNRQNQRRQDFGQGEEN